MRSRGRLGWLILGALWGCRIDLSLPISNDLDLGPADGDLGVVDGGPPRACRFDQDTPPGTGCPEGEVCNLATGTCSPGIVCADDVDCASCSASHPAPMDCGHGYRLTAWCDLSHGPEPGFGTCVRVRSPCERCEADEDCGFQNDGLSSPPGFPEAPMPSVAWNIRAWGSPFAADLAIPVTRIACLAP
ncbi:MAG: hypothetical protein HC923_11310 [Myxococcales bacterium]|nr:hypothetical protein [Myxococcales bacterium]